MTTTDSQAMRRVMVALLNLSADDLQQVERLLRICHEWKETNG